MNNFDLLLVILCFFSLLVGWVRGFLASSLSSLNWILSIIINHKLFLSLEPFFLEKFKSKFLTFTLGYCGGLLICLIFFSLVNALLLSLMKGIRLGYLDKVAGASFGLVRGFFLVAFSFFAFNQAMIALIGDRITALPDIIQKAKSLPLLEKSEALLANYLPIEEVGIDRAKVIRLITKITFSLPPSKVKNIKETSLVERLKALWFIYQEEKGKSLTNEEIELIKRICLEKIKN